MHKHVLSKVTRSDAAENRNHRQDGHYIVTIGHVDLPAYVSNGVLYVQAPLAYIFEALGEDISEFISDMEVRVSKARRSALSYDRPGRAIYRSRVVGAGVVRNRGGRR